MPMLYSPRENTFLPSSLLERYREEGSLPEDCIEVSDETAQEYMGVAPAGKQRVAGKDGMPCWVKIEPEPAFVRRQQAIDWVDATADRIRASDRSVGQYLDAEYQLAAQALIEYRNNPEGEVPDAIRSYAVAEGLTVEQAAEQIAEAAARAEDLLQAVRRIRLAGKAAIRDAGDDADFMATARPFIDQLETLLSV